MTVLISACGSMSNGPTRVVTSAEAQALIDADNAFAQASYTRGADAWADAWADGGMKPDTAEAPAFGKEAVRKQMQGLYSDANTRLQWHPLRAEVSPGGNLGYTWGRYLLTGKDPAGNAVSREGTYVTVWEKQKDGSWKILFHTGDGDKKKN
jgi:ketosteroid isomerase-like protein